MEQQRVQKSSRRLRHNNREKRERGKSGAREESKDPVHNEQTHASTHDILVGNEETLANVSPRPGQDNSQSSVGTVHAQVNDMIMDQVEGFERLNVDPAEPTWELGDE